MAKKGKVAKNAKTGASTQSTASSKPKESLGKRSSPESTNHNGPLDKLLLPARKCFPNNKFRIEEIHPGCIWVVHDFLKPAECKAWIDHVEGTQELEQCGHPASKYVAHRECYRWQRNDTKIANLLYERMKQTGVLAELEKTVDFPSQSYVPVACNHNIRFYKYTTGMSFGKHIDGSHRVDGVGDTEVTVLVYLSECKGGATRFYPSSSSKKSKSLAFEPKVGSLLLHIHGDRCLEHEADPVESGTKYILRTDVVYAG
jgi:hypothetical protein